MPAQRYSLVRSGILLGGLIFIGAYFSISGVVRAVEWESWEPVCSTDSMTDINSCYVRYIEDVEYTKDMKKRVGGVQSKGFFVLSVAKILGGWMIVVAREESLSVIQGCAIRVDKKSILKVRLCMRASVRSDGIG